MRRFKTRQVTFAPHGHILTNVGVWTPDSRWIVHDCRSDAAGSVFDSDRIERVDVETLRVDTLYRARHGAACGVVTCHPQRDEIVFIHGPEHPDASWSYGASRRRGVVLAIGSEHPETLDARDLTPPFTRGALRGGSHVHTWSADGTWIAFTYEDQYLVEQAARSSQSPAPACETNQRLVGVACPSSPVVVPRTHPRNHDGRCQSMMVIAANDSPQPGSHELLRADSDAWIGTRGYVSVTGKRIDKAIAFQGRVPTRSGDWIDEVFVVDLPATLDAPDPARGDWTSRRLPPAPGCQQRRLTWTEETRYPGLQGPRHWLRSTPDGERVLFLRRDGDGIVQLHGVRPSDGQTRRITRNASDIESAFTVSPCGRWVAHGWRGGPAVTDLETGETTAIADGESHEFPMRPEACVWSPDGHKIAYVRPVRGEHGIWNQIFVSECQSK